MAPKIENTEQSKLTVPISNHSSNTAKSREDAGGEVPTTDYLNKTPGSNVVRR